METMEINNEKVVSSNEPKYRGVKAMPFVIGNETFEKLGTIGTSANLLVYLTTVFHMKNITAINLVNIFNGTCNVGTLAGAFLSDTYFGRYKTLGFASISSFLGMLVLTLTAGVSDLHPPPCGTEETSLCSGPTTGQMVILLSAFGLLVIGASGIRPCNLAFGADQFNPNTESGKRGISSFFNWYYFTFTFAMMVSLTVIVYVQSDVSWSLGLAIPTCLMFLSCFFFFVGTRIYVKVVPQGSPLTSIVHVTVAAIKKRGLKLPEQPRISLYDYIPSNCINSKLPYTDQFRFLNKASILTPDDQINPDRSASNPWRLCSIQQVEELKCLLRIIPIWIAGIIYYIVLAQQHTFVVFQALQSDRRLGNRGFKIPAASYQVFTMLSLTIWIPIYDRLIVPFLRKVTKKENGITVLQKMGIGIFLAVIAMIVSALVEYKRRTLAFTKPTIGVIPRKGAISSMSGYWLIPQLAIAGLSEAFSVVGQVEFFYKQFPENMRSIGGAFLFCGMAVSNYLSSFFIEVIHRSTEGGKSGNWLPEESRPQAMSDQIARGEELEKRAEKKLNGWGLFGSKYEDASDLFDQAATAFKVGKSWDQAGSAYVKLANCHLKMDSKHEAANAYADAAHCYKKTNTKESVSCLDQAVNMFLDIGRLNMSARYYKEIAELYEAEQNFEQAIVYYERAADLFQSEEVTTSANQCKQKIAQFGAQLEQYQKAIGIYEEIARQSLNNNLLKYGVKGHLLNAGICQLCKGDVVAITNALERYQELDPTFSGTREYRLLSDLAAAVDDEDVSKFTDAVKEFDSMTQLDAWKTTLLLRVKEQLKAKELEEDDLT